MVFLSRLLCFNIDLDRLDRLVISGYRTKISSQLANKVFRSIEKNFLLDAMYLIYCTNCRHRNFGEIPAYIKLLFCSCRTSTPGGHKVDVFENGQHIHNSPFKCQSYNPEEVFISDIPRQSVHAPGSPIQFNVSIVQRFSCSHSQGFLKMSIWGIPN